MYRVEKNLMNFMARVTKVFPSCTYMILVTDALNLINVLYKSPIPLIILNKVFQLRIEVILPNNILKPENLMPV